MTEKDKMNKFKTEVANELGIDLNKENLTAREAGEVGGEMTKRMIEAYKEEHQK